MSPLNEYKPTIKESRIENQFTAASTEDHFPLGFKLFERYEVIKTLLGGMGIVYIVRDTKLGWFYAVKTPKIDGYTITKNALKQFVFEIEHLIALPPHQNIVQIEYLRFIGERPFIFMEYIEGKNLYEKLAERKGKGLDFQDAFDYAYQICEGMKFLHENGRILHLDLKPNNIIIDQSGFIKITDFGISKSSTNLTRQRTIQRAGTSVYMSPEQIMGEPVDIWSDIYSFGVVLYEMLTGTLPYPFDIMSIKDNKSLECKLLEFHKNEYDFHETFSHHQIINGLSDTIGTIIGHCLAKRYSKRVYNFSHLQQWIENYFSQYIKKRYPRSFQINYFKKAINLQMIEKHSEALEYFNRALLDRPYDPTILEAAAKSAASLGMKKEETMLRAQMQKSLLHKSTETLISYEEKIKERQ